MKLSQFIAGCFGIVGLVISIIAGLYADNGFNAIVTRAMLAAGLCYVVGFVVGVMAQHAADEHGRLVADKVAAADAEEAMHKEEETRRVAEEDATATAEREAAAAAGSAA